MTRKDYTAIAKILSESSASTGEIERLAKQFADLFESDNALFNRERFYAACNVDPA